MVRDDECQPETQSDSTPEPIANLEPSTDGPRDLASVPLSACRPENPDEARILIEDAYRSVLLRSPGEHGLESYTDVLLSGELAPIGLYHELLDSDEFRATTLGTRSGLRQTRELSEDERRAQVEAARELTTEAFELVLKRPPEDNALEAYAQALAGGGLQPISLVQELMASEEFGRRAFLHGPIARHLVREAVSVLVDEDAGPESVDTYARALQEGQGVAGLLREFLAVRIKPERARQLTTEAFELVLRRPPDDIALEAYSEALADGGLQPLSLVHDLLASEEFGRRALVHPPVARHLVRTAISALVDENASEETLNALCRAMEQGYGIADFFREHLTGRVKPEQARQLTTEAFQLVLRRPPDEVALGAYSQALAGGLQPLSLVQDLLESEEFGRRAFVHPPVARHLVRTAVPAFVDEDASEETLSAHSRTLEQGYGLADFFREQLTARPKPQQARQLAIEAFELVLRRAPDEAALEAYSQALAAGLQPLALMKDLLASEEFSRRALAHPLVARHVVRTLMSTVTGREPDDEAAGAYSDAIQAYSDALQDGLGLAEFVQELLTSPEYGGRPASPNARVRSRGIAPLSLGYLAEGLIAAQLTSEGCKLAIPPQQTAPAFMSEAQLASLIRTLAMLASASLAENPNTSDRIGRSLT